MIIRRQSGTFQLEEDAFSKGAEEISEIYLEVILLMKFSTTKPEIKIMITKYYDLY